MKTVKHAQRLRTILCAVLLSQALNLLLTGSAHTAMIVHSNDVLGEIEPCGCRANPLGGVARKANFLNQLREKDPSLLQIDAGDLLFPSDAMPELLINQSELQAKYLIRTLGELKLDAFVPGEKEFALGYSSFNQLRKNISFKILAANLKKRNGAQIFDRHAIFKRAVLEAGKSKTLRIGVFGLVGDQLAWPSDLKVSPSIAAAKAEVKALRGKSDLIIALTHQGYEKDLQLAKEVPGIDLIIGGHSQSFLQKPVQVGKTWIYQSSFRNQYLGVIPLNQPVGPDAYQLIAMDAHYDSSAEKSNPADRLIKEFKTSLAELNSKKEAAITEASATDEQEEKGYQTFPRCAECHLKQFDFWRKTPHVRALESLVNKEQSMNKECMACHTTGLGQRLGFSDLSRIGEFHRLVKSESDAHDFVNEVQRFTHPEMVSFLKKMEAASSLQADVQLISSDPPMTLRRAVGTISRAWAPVQCENCHQPGANHPFSGGYSKKVETSTCLKCHTAERAPQWYRASGQPDLEKIQTKRAQVACPAGELSPDTE